ncbi:MAG: hypothetical protein FWB84_08360 [Candidatus Bathyarchaeota archaeon]|uniref:hypothetical protein n=1 Tax=Candidatus Bathycorpusculum sp. TaxID=2994959 RepID=UPI0028327253|nr:hypothetical protein [Candidatus Termiticorpusculum sp.]MCL2258186.1 hypothetical protein [Candidatus Termiticorpusculum sp.]MCL2291478.1 hypothetical protein [Candidatus Termiticorpusculum sp.]
MSNSQGIELNFKIGVLKELYKQQLITKEELDRALKIVENNHAEIKNTTRH